MAERANYLLLKLEPSVPNGTLPTDLRIYALPSDDVLRQVLELLERAGARKVWPETEQP